MLCSLFYPFFTRCPCLHQSTFCAPTPESPKQLHMSQVILVRILWCFKRLRNDKNQSRRAWPQNVYGVICVICVKPCMPTATEERAWVSSSRQLSNCSVLSLSALKMISLMANWVVGICVRRKAVAGVLCTAVDPAPTSQHQRGYHPREVLRNRFFCWMGMLPVLYGNIERSPMYSIQYNQKRTWKTQLLRILCVRCLWLGITVWVTTVQATRIEQTSRNTMKYLLQRLNGFPNACSPKTGPVGPACVLLPVFEARKACCDSDRAL